MNLFDNLYKTLIYDNRYLFFLEGIKNTLIIAFFFGIIGVIIGIIIALIKNYHEKTYKLKENEYSDGYNENGELIVINKNESFDKLIQRLMRYTDSCEIISPKNLRDEMIQILNDTISNYDLDENK